MTKVSGFDWADSSDRCGIERRLLVREMNRMIKVLRIALPILLPLPNYIAEERTMLQKISDRALQQAKQLEIDAQMIAKAVIE
ncbi:MAG TPA: hypothetical protein VMV40_07900 [Acidiferrobacter sp.]|nr:hypothetical protein [Acidiferrobacter sp.]